LLNQPTKALKPGFSKGGSKGSKAALHWSR